MTTTAIRDGDPLGGQWPKVWTSGAATAEYGLLIAWARIGTPKHRGHQLLHDPDAPTRYRGAAIGPDHRRSAISTRSSFRRHGSYANLLGVRVTAGGSRRPRWPTNVLSGDAGRGSNKPNADSLVELAREHGFTDSAIREKARHRAGAVTEQAEQTFGPRATGQATSSSTASLGKLHDVTNPPSGKGASKPIIGAGALLAASGQRRPDDVELLLASTLLHIDRRGY